MPTAELALWLLAVQAAGLAALPLALSIFRALPDGGYALSKPLGLLLVAYLVWLPGMLGFLAYQRATALMLLLGLALCCWWRSGPETLAWLRGRVRSVALLEAVFLGAGLVGAFVRAYNADVIGQEKFMDLAFFNGFLAASSLPAEDTWLAGYGMPYYPFGYLLLSVPTKLAGLPAAYGYNLALVLVFGLTFVLATSLSANLVALLRDRRGADGGPDGVAFLFGLTSGALVAVCGNLVGPLELLATRGLGSPGFWAAVGVKNLHAAPGPGGWLPADGGWWWHASRVIPTIQPDGITEFPYFSFILGDLHPHFTALPLLVLIAALALCVLVECPLRRDPAGLGVAGLALGVPIVANTWDVATFWLLYGLAAGFVWWRARRAGQAGWAGLGWGLAPLALGVALFSPYFVGYASQRLGLGFVTEGTPLVSLLIIFGPFLVVAALGGLRLARPAGTDLGRARWAGLAALLVGLGLVATERWSAALGLGLLVLLVAAGERLAREWAAEDGAARAAGLYLALLGGLGLAVLVGTELIYIRDSFGTRMNTVFKFHYHVWLLLGLLGGPALALWMAQSTFHAPSVPARVVGGVVLAGTLALGLVYPLAATWSKSQAFRGPATLDGAAFLERSKPGDAAAIRWLAGRPDRPVVLEAVGGDYEEFARVSTFSGLPTVLGWVGHELQWRGPLDEYARRQQDIENLYRRAERDEGVRILNRYGVKYVFVGSLEKQKYGGQIEARLGQWLTPVFRRDGTVVFALTREDEVS